jgi:hypothetical protein
LEYLIIAEMFLRSAILLILLSFAAPAIEVSASKTIKQITLHKQTRNAVKLKKKNKKKILKFSMSVKKIYKKNKRIAYPFS